MCTRKKRPVPAVIGAACNTPSREQNHGLTCPVYISSSRFAPMSARVNGGEAQGDVKAAWRQPDPHGFNATTCGRCS